MRTIAAFLFLGLSAEAQLLSFGIRGGLPLTEAYSELTISQSSGIQVFTESRGYAIGPMAELHLPLGFSVEADALYRPINLTTTQGISGATTTPTNLNSWEFPVVGKYRFLHLPIVKPYVEGGPSFRYVGAGNFSSAGFILGLGVEIKIGRIRIEPDIRYDRWGADAQSVSAYPPSQLNQAEFLVGIAF